MRYASGHFSCERQVVSHIPGQKTTMRINGMMHNMEGMGWMMGAMGIVWIVVIIFLVLGIAAFVKYLRSGR